MSYSNRVLKDLIDYNEIFAQVHIINGDTLSFAKNVYTIYYKDIKAGSSFDESYDSSGNCSIIFKNHELFNSIRSEMVNAGTVVEIIIQDEVNIIAGITNPLYVANQAISEQNIAENKETLTLNLITFSDMYEKNTIAEHTKEYDSLSTDPDTGRNIIPEDFNTIVYTNTERIAGARYDSIITSLFHDNLLTDYQGDNYVFDRLMGGVHTNDADRACKGFRYYGSVYPSDAPETQIDYTSNKKSVFDVREDLYQTSRSKSGYANRELLLFESVDDYFNVMLHANPELNATIRIDKAQYSKIDVTMDTDIGDVLVESGSPENDWSWVRGKVKKIGAIKNLEAIAVATDTEQAPNAMYDTHIKILNGNEITQNSELEIFFKDKNYFKGQDAIRAGRVINITNEKGDTVKYLIRKISAVLNDTHISYSMDELEQLSHLIEIETKIGRK